MTTLERSDFQPLSGDRIALAPGVELSPEGLVDGWRGGKLQCNPIALETLTLMREPIRWGEVRQTLARRHGVDENRVEADCLPLFSELDGAALITVDRDRRSWAKEAAALTTTLRRPALPAPSTRRYPPTLAGVAQACFKASRWFWLPAVLLGVLPLATGLLPTPVFDGASEQLRGWGLIVLAPLLVVALCTTGLLIAHEYGHVLAARRVGAAWAMVIRRGLKVSVLHAPMTGPPRRSIALAGPLSAFAVAVAGAALAWWLGAWGLVVAGIVGTGLLHFICLAPWQADGRGLRSGASDDHGREREQQ